jgi:hypothetical protein
MRGRCRVQFLVDHHLLQFLQQVGSLTFTAGRTEVFWSAAVAAIGPAIEAAGVLFMPDIGIGPRIRLRNG